MLQLKSNKQRDLSRWVWQHKQQAWKNLNLTLVNVWLAQCAKESSLLKTSVKEFRMVWT